MTHSIDNDPNTKQPLPPLPWTISEAARIWGVSRSVVKKLVAQNRVKHERRGGGATRAQAVLILQTGRPPRLAHGALLPSQREGWNRGRKKAKKVG